MELLEFSGYLSKLKRLKRTGWVREGVPDSESVADHSFGIALLAMVLAKEYGMDQSRAIKMALVHDIGESIVGDFVIDRGVKRDRKVLKKRLPEQRNAIIKIFSLMGDKEALELLDEFDANRTREARLVRQLDKLEMAMQAYDYENAYGITLGEFYVNASKWITDKRIKKELAKLLSVRTKK